MSRNSVVPTTLRVYFPPVATNLRVGEVKVNVFSFFKFTAVVCATVPTGSVKLPAPMMAFAHATLQWIFDRGQLDASPGLLAGVISGSGPHTGLSREQLIERIEAVTAPDLEQTANQFFQTDHIAVTILGNLNGLRLTREQLVC